MAYLPHSFITARGVDAIEGAINNSTRPSNYFPSAINILHIGTANNSPIVQGGQGTNQNFQQNSWQGVDSIALAAELDRLMTALSREASSPEHYVTIGHIASAEIGAKEKNHSKVRSC